jgi:hypothetical protein
MIRRVLLLLLIAGFFYGTHAYATWNVEFESKTVSANEHDVEFNLKVYWDIALQGFAIPVVVREIDPGSFWTGAMPYDTGGNAYDHPFQYNVSWNWTNQWANLTEEMRPGVPFGTCSPDGDTGYDGISPDHFSIHAAGIGGSTPAEPAGLDVVTITFDVTGSLGQFEFDTACFSTSLNTIYMVDNSFPPIEHGLMATFGKGVITIAIPHDPPQILSTLPAQNELNVAASNNISVTFDIDMDETTINGSTFVVNAWYTGLHQGTITYDGPTKTATFDPLEDFEEGEVVTVTLTTGVQSSESVPLDSAYLWSFTSVVYDGPGIFATQTVYPVGDGPYSVFSADLDGDGDLDLATADSDSTNVSVLLNNGDGAFAPHSVYPVGDHPSSVFSADMDGDGDLDLATANRASDNVSLLLNNGDGSFAPHSVYPVGDYPWSVFSADLDGDGDLDLTTANTNSDNVSVLLNNGDGTFATHSVYAVGSYPYSVFSADLDGDGDLDLAVANSGSNNVSVLLNNGDGTFAQQSVYPVGDRPLSVFSADLDGDGDLDLTTANVNSGNVPVLLNNGDGTFAPHSVNPVGDNPKSVFSADLDGDGDLDLTTANANSDNVSVLLNDGDGTFATHSVYPVGDSPRSVFSADLDGDGDLDLATANEVSDNVSVLFNQPCDCGTNGDVNHDVSTDPLDVSYLVNKVFLDQDALHDYTATCPYPNGDVNCDSSTDPLDVSYLVNKVFLDQDALCARCP